MDVASTDCRSSSLAEELVAGLDASHLEPADLPPSAAALVASGN